VQASDVEASLKAWLLASVLSARAAASISNLKQIGLACAMYKQDRKGEWPDTLQQLVERGYLHANVLRNPIWPAQEVGYVYRKPAKDAPAGVVVLYEKHDGWPAYGVAVGFVDCAVMRLEDPERFKQMLEQGR
jgi:hypothetical protein